MAKHTSIIMDQIFLQKAIVNKAGGFGCTTFSILQHDNIVFGRNFDFMIDLGHVVVNKRSIAKKAFVEPTEKQLSWVSTYGSLTFNQIGREFPYGGMNEAGLVIELLWFDGAKYPDPDERYGLTVLQWVQYQLDTADNVDQVIKSDEKLRILQNSPATLHFFLTDASGKAACIEFIDGKMVARTGTDLPHRALTNNSYQESLDFIHGYEMENPEAAFTGNSLERFQIATEMTAQVQPQDNPVDYAFNILDEVEQEDFTQWSIVYDITEREIHFKMLRNSVISTIRFWDLDFSPKHPCQVVDLTADRKVEVNFQPYSKQHNEQLLRQVFANLELLDELPPEMKEGIILYPESTQPDRD